MNEMNNDKMLAVGRRVISREADALANLADHIGDGFSDAVEAMLNAKGRVIVSGIGKSGHIARKIASTLASTGTPAHFVHPAEASHGDLGMVTPDDVALLISYSGEAPELADIISFTRRFGIKSIGISGRKNSSLVRQTDISILLPKAEEACDRGIVPTTSTTMTLALGDALAITLMECREFTPEKFRDYHPGGNLGARLSKVGDLMHSDIPSVVSGTNMSEALIAISQKGYGAVAVLSSDDRLLGVITDGDLRRNLQGLLDFTADQVMTTDPLTIGPSNLIEDAVAQMNDRKITCLFVVDTDVADRVVGILHIHDCLRAGVT